MLRLFPAYTVEPDKYSDETEYCLQSTDTSTFDDDTADTVDTEVDPVDTGSEDTSDIDADVDRVIQMRQASVYLWCRIPRLPLRCKNHDRFGRSGHFVFPRWSTFFSQFWRTVGGVSSRGQSDHVVVWHITRVTLTTKRDTRARTIWTNHRPIRRLCGSKLRARVQWRASGFFPWRVSSNRCTTIARCAATLSCFDG